MLTSAYRSFSGSPTLLGGQARLHFERHLDYADPMAGVSDGGSRPICDVGDMSCGEGLPMEFRRNMQALEVGDTMEFLVRDPSAKEDLAPLARMMGHRILSEEELDDGALSVIVERAR